MTMSGSVKKECPGYIPFDSFPEFTESLLTVRGYDMRYFGVMEVVGYTGASKQGQTC